MDTVGVRGGGFLQVGFPKEKKKKQRTVKGGREGEEKHMTAIIRDYKKRKY